MIALLSKISIWQDERLLSRNPAQLVTVMWLHGAKPGAVQYGQCKPVGVVG